MVKIAVAVLGATGTVGQRFVSLLEDHPWFDVRVLAASDRSAGQTYGQATAWKLSTPMPARLSSQPVVLCEPEHMGECRVVFSALDSSVAGEVETRMAEAGFAVFSNARNHRMDPDVPILIPHANSEHLDLVASQATRKKNGGFIVTNANCSSTGLVVPLRALQDAFGLESVYVVTMQAVSGAGYPGVPSLDIFDNVVPYISGEEEKLQTEPVKILGKLDEAGASVRPAKFRVSAQCNRVCVLDGHTESVSVRLGRRDVTAEQVADALRSYRSPAQELGLPSAPPSPVVVFDGPDRPQPRLDRDLGRGYVVTVGRVRPCPLFDFKFTLLSHNTVLGAAGGSILNAELAVARGLLPRP